MNLYITRLKTTILTLLFILLTYIASSQYFDVGQDPASTVWKQVKTQRFIIIFPEDFTSEAIRLAHILDQVTDYASVTLRYTPQRIPIIIHNQTTISNAYALWAPRRMEFFTCVPQATYGQNWLEQLGLHEYRHIVQMNMMKQGLSRFLYYVFGEQMTAGLFGLYIPSWLMEGDAVLFETTLSRSGRGRLPEFDMYYRALLSEKKPYHFNKAVCGSYKDFVPSDYYLGYYFVSGARNKYGYEIWNESINRIAKNPLLLTGMRSGIKKATGMKTSTLYASVFNELDSLWKVQNSTVIPTPYKKITRNNRYYTNYSMPCYLNDSSILCLKGGFDFEKQFVVVNTEGKEKRIFTPGFFNPVRMGSNGEGPVFSFEDNKKFEELNFSCNRRYIAWAEAEFDKRWAQRTWSVIKLYDIETRKGKKLTHKTRYFAPAIAPGGQTIVATEVTTANHFSLVFLDLKTGQVLKKFETPVNDFFITPAWSQDGSSVFVVYMNQQGQKGIMQIDAATLQSQVLIQPSFTEYFRPVHHGNHLFFNGIFSGISNIYAFDLRTGGIFMVTSSRFGAFYPDISADGKKMLYSNYTNNGFEVVETNIDSTAWKPLEAITNNAVKMYEKSFTEEKGIPNFDTVPKNNYRAENYSRLLHLFNFHSWIPASADLSTNDVQPGLMLMSQNRLSTAFTILNYGFDTRNKNHRFTGSFIYKGWYPVIGLHAQYGSNKSYFREYLETNDREYSWNEFIAGMEISLPLNLTTNRFYRQLNLVAGFDQIKVLRTNETPDSVYTGDISAISAGFKACNMVKMSDRDIASRWGQSIAVEWHKSLLNDYAGELLSIEAAAQFPGLGRHHVIKLSYGFQEILQDKYRFASVTAYPRGIKTYNDKTIQRYSIDYKFPLWHPDLSIGSMFYIKRFKTAFFYDYAATTNFKDLAVEYQTSGIELTSDFHIFRSIIPLNAGFRTSVNLLDNYSLAFDFLFAINFDSF